MLIVGYFTPGVYADMAARLRVNLDRFGLAHDLQEVPEQGSWIANCAYKSRFVKSMLEKHRKPIVQLDVDAEIREYPTLLNDLNGCDVAASRFNGNELLSGTVYFSASATCMAVVDRWIELCAMYPTMIPPGVLSYHPKGTDAWDQRLLWLAIVQTPNVHFTDLPPSYCYIEHDNLTKTRYPDALPVIAHQCASYNHPDKVAARCK